MTDSIDPKSVTDELEAVLKKHGLSAVFVVATKDVVVWKIAMADWSAFQFDGARGRMNMQLRFETAENEADTAVSMGVLYDMGRHLEHCAAVCRESFELAKGSLDRLGVQLKLGEG